MINIINYISVRCFDILSAFCRLPFLDKPALYWLRALGPLQPLLEKIGRLRAYEVYRHAQQTCPAYRKFLAENYAPSLTSGDEFEKLPFTDKASYIKKFSIEERCHYGRLPTSGVVIDESSGSSGVPNNWVRGPEERRSVKRLIQHAYTVRYGSAPLMVINCFALGPWATGMNVSMALVDLAILKSVGPDKAKLDATLQLFGPRYRYALAGYPPFFKDWFSSTAIDLKNYELHLIVGGEGISEGLRDFFLERCKTVCSSYGASDLEINIGIETDFTIALRKLCTRSPELSRKLFGRTDAPMIFQYNPSHYLIEKSPDGELVVTVLRTQNAAPRVRYNIRDIGGSVLFREAVAILKEERVDIGALSSGRNSLPLLFVYGRNDLSVPFYGAKVFSTDIDQILNGDEKLRKAFFSFQLSAREEATLEKTLIIDLECVADRHGSFSETELTQIFFERLKGVNQDFREVSKIFTADRLMIRQHPSGSGPFAQRDIRLKNRYIAG